MRPVVDTMAVVASHQRAAPVDLTAIARDLGIEVNFEALDDTISGKLSRNPWADCASGFVISINRGHHPNRQRFTFAHELAHFILHRDLVESGIVDNTLYRSGMPDQIEFQANRLAAEILMPRELLRQYWQINPDASYLASVFGVSEAAMRIRLDSLNLNQPSLF